MQIITISPARLASRVWLEFDSGLVLPLQIDDVVKLHLQKHTDLSEDQFSSIQSTSANYLLYEYAIRQLAISPKTRLILSNKLRQYSSRIIIKYSLPSDIVQALISPVIDKIVTKGLLDDQDFVDYYCRRHSRQSSSQIKFALQSFGIKDVSLPMTSEKDKIRQLLSQKARRLNLSDFNTKTKIIGFLYRKCFALSDIKTTIDEFIRSG